MRGGAIGGVCACAAIALAGCAQILGYDDLSPRESTVADSNANDTAGIDTAPDVPLIDVADTPPPPTSVVPPQRPSGAPVPSGTGKTMWLIVNKFYLGSTTVTGAVSKDAWKDWGYDLDHVCTGPTEAAENIGTCFKTVDASSSVLVDGNGCRDNDWGSQIVPLISEFDSIFEDQANSNVLLGFGSWIFVLRDVDDGHEDPYAPGALYKAVDWQIYHSGTPRFDGSDVREVTADSVVGFDLGRPITNFPKGYVSRDVWVSGEGSDIVASVPVSGVTTDLSMFAGVATIDLGADHSAKGIGVVAGALRTEQMRELIGPVAAMLGLCPGTALYESLLSRVANYVDVVAESATLQDTTVQCDATSLGIGFTVAPIQPVTTVVDEIPFPNACDDAGTDADARADAGTDSRVDTADSFVDGAGG
jgi:hypothetical protein